MKNIFAAYTNKQLLAGLLKSALVMIYTLLLAGCIWLCKDYSPGYIVDRIIPYGIPPLLSLLTACFLSVFVLTLEQTRTETLLFSIICFSFAGLNLDIFLLGIITDHKTALAISRADHFQLALIQVGANLHLAYLVCGKKSNWWVVYLAYFVGAVMALLTPTDYYFQGLYTYFWGLFAKKAFLYDLMSSLWLMATIYCIFILSQSYRQTSDPHKKDTIKYLILGFVCTAVLSLTNTPAMYGYEIYPLGTFTFISLFLLAYGLFKYNLRIALQYLRAFIFSGGHLILITAVAFTPWILLPKNDYRVNVGIGIVMIAILYKPTHKAWDAFLNLFLKRPSNLLQKQMYTLTFKLSEIHHLKEIHQQICRWLFQIFMNSRCAMVFYNHLDGTFEGWSTWNVLYDSGFFKAASKTHAGDTPLRIQPGHPLLKKIMSAKWRLITHGMLDRWIDENNIQQDANDRLLQAGLIIPIFFQSRMISLLIIGNKINDRSYSKPEKESLQNLSGVLGPYIENAKLLEGLEHQVEKRTEDLYDALKDVKQKSNKIFDNNRVIKKQNHIFLSLFETSTQIHEIDVLNDLFEFTLNQLRTLFPRLGFGIIHVGERTAILENGAFNGISEKEQKIILKNRRIIDRRNINQIMKKKLNRPGSMPLNQESYWAVQPMQIRDNRVIGKIIIKSPGLDQITNKVISIFLAQVSAAVHNKLLMRKLENSANTDGLTGVTNRSFFDQELKRVINNSTRFPDIFFSLLAIDINGLKRINDNFGHAKGDEMIKTVADMLTSVCRDSDTLSRVGGDEFVILLPATDSRQAKTVRDRIRHAEKGLSLVCRQKNNERSSIPIRVSVGLAGSDETSAEKVMNLADQRMYIDKENFYQKTTEDLQAKHS